MLSKIKISLSLVSEKKERIKTLILMFLLIIYTFIRDSGKRLFPSLLAFNHKA